MPKWPFISVLLPCLFIFSSKAKGQDTSLTIMKDYTIYRNDTINRITKGKKEGKWMFFHIDSSIVTTISTDCYKSKNGKSYCKRKTSVHANLRITPYVVAYFQEGLKTGRWQFSCDSFKHTAAEVVFSNDTLSSDILLYNEGLEAKWKAVREEKGWLLYDRNSGERITKRYWAMDSIIREFDCWNDPINYPYKIPIAGFFKY